MSVDAVAATTTTTTTTATDPATGLPLVDDLRRRGNLWCWGSVTSDIANGYDVLLDYRSVAAGSMHTCAVETASEHLVCWGVGYGFQNLTLFEDRSEGANKTTYRQHTLTLDPAWVNGGHDASVNHVM